MNLPSTDNIERFTPTAFVSVGKHKPVQAEIDVWAEWYEGKWSGYYTIETASLVIPSAIIKQWGALFKGEADGVINAPLTMQVDGLTMEIEIDATLENGRIIKCATDLQDYAKEWLQYMINR